MNIDPELRSDGPASTGPKNIAVNDFLEQDVVIITSFEGRDPESMKRNVVDCMRLKYIIENRIKTPARSLSLSIHFNVSVAYTEQGEVNSQAFKKIVSADLLIAIVSNANANVIYELAIRSLIKPEHLILIKDAERDILPMYLQTMGYMNFDKSINLDIKHEIDKIAQNPEVNLSWNDLDNSKFPKYFDKLKDEIDLGKDEVVERDLAENLNKIYQAPSTWPGFMQDLALQIDPAGLLEAWDTYYPTSIVRVQWSRRSGRSYNPMDMAGAPVVIAGNAKFCELYGINSVGDPYNPATALTAELSLSKLKQFMSDKDFKAFSEDQENVSRIIVFDDDFTQTKVPIIISFHRDSVFNNRVFLPMLIGKKVVGNLNGLHSTYLLVTYIELSRLPNIHEI